MPIDKSPFGSFKDALDRQAYRNRRNADIVSKNIKIKAMARQGSTLAEIMTETGMGQNYIKRIAGSDLKLTRPDRRTVGGDPT